MQKKKYFTLILSSLMASMVFCANKFGTDRSQAIGTNPYELTPDEMLLKAAQYPANPYQIQLALELGANPTAQAENSQRTALMFLVEKGDTKNVELLLKTAPDQDFSVKDAWGNTALDIAKAHYLDSCVRFIKKAMKEQRKSHRQ